MSESDRERAEHKAQVEALLFAAEEPRTVRWMANFLKLQGRYVRRLLDELRREYDGRPGALEIREVYKDTVVPDDLEASPAEVFEAEVAAAEAPPVSEEEDEHAAAGDLDGQDLGDESEDEAAAGRAARPRSIPSYHLAVRFEQQHLVQRLLPPELSKPVLGTLSLIATRQPILQSEIIHSRGKRAYAHIKDLLVHRLISRRPVDGTYSLSTTSEFQRRYQVDPAAVRRTRKLSKGKRDAASKAGPPPPQLEGDVGSVAAVQGPEAPGEAGIIGVAGIGVSS